MSGNRILKTVGFAPILAMVLLLHSPTVLADSSETDQEFEAPTVSSVLDAEDWDAAGPEPDDPNVNWLSNSHLYLSNQTQALTNWMDSFFGDETYDAEQAESLIRIEFIEDWHSIDSNKFKVKIRGRVHLPKISQRLSLVFNGEEDVEDRTNDFDRLNDDSIGLQYSPGKADNSEKSRLDYTMGWSAGHLRPGIRWRLQGEFNKKTNYRLTERIQYEHEKQFYSRTQFRVSHLLDESRIVNWSNRLNYGEKTLGVEWSSQLLLFQRYRVESSRPIAISYYAGLSGVTRPDSYVGNYSAGLVYRRQLKSKYVFLEFEPSIGRRKLDAQSDRELTWQAVLRLEVALSHDTPRY